MSRVRFTPCAFAIMLYRIRNIRPRLSPPRRVPGYSSGGGAEPDNGHKALCPLSVEPAAGCAIAWILLLLSAVANAMQYCATDEYESDDEDRTNTMYS